MSSKASSNSGLPDTYGENYTQFRDKIILSDRLVDNYFDLKRKRKEPFSYMSREASENFKKFCNLFGTSNTAYARNAVFKTHSSIIENIEKVMLAVIDNNFESLFVSKDDIFNDLDRTLNERDKAYIRFSKAQEKVYSLLCKSKSNRAGHFLKNKPYYGIMQEQAVCTFNISHDGYLSDKYVVHAGPDKKRVDWKISTSLAHIESGYINYGNRTIEAIDGYCFISDYVKDLHYYEECNEFLDAASHLNLLSEEVRFFALTLMALYYKKQESTGYFIGSFSNKNHKFFVSMYLENSNTILDVLRENEIRIL